MKVSREKQNFSAFFVQEAQNVRDKVIATLKLAGEKSINDARLQGSYTDRTGNLRSSTGYVILEDGNVIFEGGFSSVLSTAHEGPDSGRILANDVGRNYPEGLVLIIVAGMSYAEYVQDKGYNVLVSAERIAESTISKLLKQIQ